MGATHSQVKWPEYDCLPVTSVTSLDCIAAAHVMGKVDTSKPSKTGLKSGMNEHKCRMPISSFLDQRKHIVHASHQHDVEIGHQYVTTQESYTSDNRIRH
jgi:hypothetical protein